MGFNRVIATHGALTVDFTADGIAGPPAAIVKVSGDNQYVLPSSRLKAPAVVSVRDANDNPVAGAPVTFSVASGGGLLFGPATVMSDVIGVARFDGWIMGDAGPQSLRASVEGAPHVLFAAVATTDPCVVLSDIASGVPATLTLNDESCVLDTGGRGISFGLHVPGTVGYEVSPTSASFESRVMLKARNGDPVGEAEAGVSTPAILTAVLPPGDYIVTTASRNTDASGLFTMSARVVSQQVTGCRDLFLARGVATGQTISATDCAGPQIGSREDHYRVFLRAGTTVEITMGSATFDTRLEVYGPDNNDLLASAEENVSYLNYDSHLLFNVPKSGYYLIKAMCIYGEGSYSMVIE
jgi:hypothetical protein